LLRRKDETEIKPVLQRRRKRSQFVLKNGNVVLPLFTIGRRNCQLRRNGTPKPADPFTLSSYEACPATPVHRMPLSSKQFRRYTRNPRPVHGGRHRVRARPAILQAPSVDTDPFYIRMESTSLRMSQETGKPLWESGFFPMASHWPPIKGPQGVPPPIVCHTSIGNGFFVQIGAV
jgi:hypothetical protein